MRFLIILGLFLIPFSASAAYDIKRDYCGVVAPVQLCKCAFHGQMCDGLGMSKSAANAKLMGEFEAWKKKKEEALMFTCTISGEHEWKNGKCVKKKTEEAKVEEKPKCEQLYQPDKDGVCAFAGARGIRFDAESAEAFQAFVEGLAEGDGGLFEGKDIKGRPIRVGIVRAADGGYVFTGDGVRFFDNAKDAAAPGVWQKGLNAWDNLGRWFGGLFGVGKFAGRDTAGDAAKQREGQLMLDAATLAMDAMKEKLGEDREGDEEKSLERLDSWVGRTKKVLGEEYDDLIVDELGEMTGLDTKSIRRAVEDGSWEKVVEGKTWEEVRDGKIEDLQDDTLDGVKEALYGVPAEAIKTLDKELKRDRFADSVRAYATEREAGRTAGDVFAAFGRGDLPELEAMDLAAHGQFYERAALFVAYEDAYQRYRVMRDLRK
jgi:hypothetical protein